MVTQPPRDSNNKHRQRFIKQKDPNDDEWDGEVEFTLDSMGMSYEIMPLNLGASARHWLHDRLRGIVVAENSSSKVL